MKPLHKAICTSLLLPAATASLSARNGDRPMNILFILADDFGYECLGANGSTYETECLDALARQGILFENCHSQPLSTPSRVQLMTGRYNDRNYTDFAYLDPKERTFAHMAKELGYATCIAGKWQLGYDKRLPEVFGFDRYCLWQLTKKAGDGERYADVLYEKDGKMMPRSIDVYGPDVFSDYIEDFIVENKERPFFAYYPMVLTHDPFMPTPDSDEWEKPELRQVRDPKNMADMVKYTDKIVCHLIDVLEREGLRENTIVFFVGDNGTHPKILTPMKDGSVIQGGKWSTTRYGTHVPMIVSCPALLESGTVNSNLIDFSDFYVTLRDIMGGDGKNDNELDGISFWPQLLGKKAGIREMSFCHYQWINKINYERFAQTIEYKLYQDGRFFNTVEDPLEKNPIDVGNEDKKIKKLHSRLQKLLDSRPAWGKGILDRKGGKK